MQRRAKMGRTVTVTEVTKSNTSVTSDAVTHKPSLKWTDLRLPPSLPESAGCLYRDTKYSPIVRLRIHWSGASGHYGTGTTVQYSTPCCHLDTKIDKRHNLPLSSLLPVLTSCASVPMPWQTYSTIPTTIILGNNNVLSSVIIQESSKIYCHH
jgi:hypothetical protein